MKQLQDLHEAQLANQQFFPSTGSQGLANQDKMLCQALEDSPKGMSGVKGSLKRVFDQKQPWSFKMEMEQNKHLVELNPNLINSQKKMEGRVAFQDTKRDQILEFRFCNENHLKVINENNKFTDEKPHFATKTELFEQKLNLQKQNLLKLQKIQQEQRKMRYGSNTKDLNNLKDKFEKIKRNNDEQLSQIYQREKMIKSVRRSENVTMQPMISPGKDVTYKTGYDFFKKQNYKQPYSRNWDRSGIDPEILNSTTLPSIGAPPLLPRISPEVRISSNRNDTDIDVIMKKLMVQRVDHVNFDPILGKKETREYIKGLVFQDSVLSPYQPYIKYSNTIGTNEDLLPKQLGATQKDFQRAKWLNAELNKKPYFENTGVQQKKQDEELKVDDPLVIQAKFWENKKQKEQEQFEEKVAQIFHMNKGNISAEQQSRIYDMQVAHTIRLMAKSSNQNIHGLPEYLDSLRIKDANKYRDMAKQILKNKYDWKRDEEFLQSIIDDVKEFKKLGGVPKKKDFKEYPGDKKMIQKMEKQYDFKYRTGIPEKKEELNRKSKFSKSGRSFPRSEKSGGSLNASKSPTHSEPFFEQKSSNQDFDFNQKLKFGHDHRSGGSLSGHKYSELDQITIDADRRNPFSNKRSIDQDLIGKMNTTHNSTQNPNETSRVMNSQEDENLFSNSAEEEIISIEISPDKKQPPPIKITGKILLQNQPKKKKKNPNLTERVKTIKTSLKLEVDDLQKYSKPKVQSQNIYQDSQIAEIMDEEWLDLVIKNAQKYIPDNGLPTLNSSFNKSKMEMMIGDLKKDKSQQNSQTTIQSQMESFYSSKFNKTHSAKFLGQKVQKFIDNLEVIQKNSVSVEDMEDFEKIAKVMKENSILKIGIIKYLEMITSNPNKTDLEQNLDDFIQDEKLIQKLMKENFLSPERIEKMKKENFNNSLMIASFGERNTLWMPNKFNFNPTLSQQKRKAPLIRFDKDGKAYYPDE